MGVCVYVISGVRGQKRRKRSIRNSGSAQKNKLERNEEFEKRKREIGRLTEAKDAFVGDV